MATICVFCAASSKIATHYVEIAAEVGAELARRGHDLVTGGGSVSSMGAVSRAARDGGAHTVGVIPEPLLASEVADTGAAELIVTNDMRTRKGIMDERSDAFLVLPGGIGTLEELLEVWTSRSLGMHTKPVVVLDPFDDFAGLRDLVRALGHRGFVRPSAAAHLQWARDVDDALDLVEGGLPPRTAQDVRAVGRDGSPVRDTMVG